MPTNIQYRAADGATVISGPTKDLGQIVSSPTLEVDTTPIKLTVENLSDRALGAAPFTTLVLRRQQIGVGPAFDGYTFVYTATDPNGTLSKPFGAGVDAGGVLNGAPVITDGGINGVWAAVTRTYGVVVTATVAGKETIASVEADFLVTIGVDDNRKRLYTWVQTPSATGYKVYRTAVAGTFGDTTLIAAIGNGATVTYIDDGAAPGVGTPPLVNNTGGDGPTYGTPPAVVDHTSADKTIATAAGGGLRVGQQWFFWLIAKVPAGSTSIGNKRSLRIIPVEL